MTTVSQNSIWDIRGTIWDTNLGYLHHSAVIWPSVSQNPRIPNRIPKVLCIPNSYPKSDPYPKSVSQMCYYQIQRSFDICLGKTAYLKWWGCIFSMLLRIPKCKKVFQNVNMYPKVHKGIPNRLRIRKRIPKLILTPLRIPKRIPKWLNVSENENVSQIWGYSKYVVTNAGKNQ